MMEIIGTLLAFTKTFLVLSTAEGRKKVPYKEIDITYDGMSLDELIRKKVKLIILEDGTTIQITKPK